MTDPTGQEPDPTAPPSYAPSAQPNPPSYPPPAQPEPPSYPPPGQGGYPPPAYAPQPGYPAPGQGGYPPPGQGAYPPPGYAPQPGYPPAPAGFGPPPKKRRKWPWIVAGSVVVVVVALVIIGIVAGRKGSGDPHTAADKFWHALVQKDTKQAQKYVCAKKDLTNDAGFKQMVDALTGYDIGAESGTGNTRTYPVTLHLSLAGQTGDQVVITTVKKDTGQWYVCDLGNQ